MSDRLAIAIIYKRNLPGWLETRLAQITLDYLNNVLTSSLM